MTRSSFPARLQIEDLLRENQIRRFCRFGCLLECGLLESVDSDPIHRGRDLILRAYFRCRHQVAGVAFSLENVARLPASLFFARIESLLDQALMNPNSADARAYYRAVDRRMREVDARIVNPPRGDPYAGIDRSVDCSFGEWSLNNALPQGRVFSEEEIHRAVVELERFAAVDSIDLNMSLEPQVRRRSRGTVTIKTIAKPAQVKAAPPPDPMARWKNLERSAQGEDLKARPVERSIGSLSERFKHVKPAERKDEE